MNESLLATIAIGISSVSIVIIFEIKRDIPVLRDKLADFQIDEQLLQKSFRLINAINAYYSIFILFFIVGTISSLVSVMLLTTYFNFFPKEPLENLAHYLLLFCSIIYIGILCLMCIKLFPEKLYKSD